MPVRNLPGVIHTAAAAADVLPTPHVRQGLRPHPRADHVSVRALRRVQLQLRASRLGRSKPNPAECAPVNKTRRQSVILIARTRIKINAPPQSQGLLRRHLVLRLARELGEIQHVTHDRRWFAPESH